MFDLEQTIRERHSTRQDKGTFESSRPNQALQRTAAARFVSGTWSSPVPLRPMGCGVPPCGC